MRTSTGLTLLSILAATCMAAEHPWQRDHATVLPHGDLEWAPEPHHFRPGANVRYIDFAAGDDAADGTREEPWKHHPWDARAGGQAAQASGSMTYVFKQGVAYRGQLRPDEHGTPDAPIILTSDPGWGTGEASILGSQAVADWQQAGDLPPGMPDDATVWYADLSFAPRAVWQVADDGTIVRLPLARTPNWTMDDIMDVRAGWWRWENPEWWKTDYTTTIDGTQMHQGIDSKHLTEEPGYYQDAYVWSEWGIMMGAPYAARVEGFDPGKHAIAFQGPWHRTTQKIMENNRYYLEDKPHYLDSAGEYWFDKRGDGGRLFLRLPDDGDPNAAHIEAAQHIMLIEATGLSHVEISGLRFGFGNVHWNLDYRFFQHPDVRGAAIRIQGECRDVTIRNNRFHDVVKAIHIDCTGALGEAIRISDNEILRTDHGGLEVTVPGKPGNGVITDTAVLRNRLFDIGKRPLRPNGHFALQVSNPRTALIAGNILERCYAAGIDMHGGKGSNTAGEAPFTRFIVYQNKVTDVVLGSNDWGGIETWQGGPFYIYNNVVGNALGPMYWSGKTFSHAYYLDGAFKNYHFNNIAWGVGNDPDDPRAANMSAFQEIHSYQNTFFNNTAYKFLKGSRRQRPDAGRNKYLGNIFSDISENVFRHSDKEGADPNAHHAGEQGEHFAYETNAYSGNILHAVGDVIASFESQGGDYRDLAQLQTAMREQGPLASDIGIHSQDPVLTDPAAHDFRPRPDSAAIGQGARVFVPWSLAATVGEWHFTPNDVEPDRIIDEHWYMTDYHRSREDYFSRPRYPLRAVGTSRADFVAGELEDWTDGALRLNGSNQHCILPDSVIEQGFTFQGEAPEVSTGGWADVTLPAAALPGEPIEISIMLDEVPTGEHIGLHLHWMRGNSFGGFNAWAGPSQQIKGPGPYTFRMTPVDKAGLTHFSAAIFVSPDGEWKNQTKVERVQIDKAFEQSGIETRTVNIGGETSGGGMVDITVSGADLRNPEIRTGDFIIEAVVSFPEGSQGPLIVKQDGQTGWRIDIDADGHPLLGFGAGGDQVSLRSDTSVTGGWPVHI
ncbi:MAG: right-handed parallel beta-helix repeat-containing protein, partial [Planctomycetota bacterium]